MNMSPDVVMYYGFMLTYLVFFAVIVATLRSMQRALTRIADRLDASDGR